jgi:SAM-dependent methyltransferase
MHRSAKVIGSAFIRNYLEDGAKVLEIGSMAVNGGLRDKFKSSINWVGVDLEPGPGVDRVLTDPYVLPFEEGEFDAVVTSSTFEHNAMFWLTFTEAVRVTKRGGLIYLNAPSNGLVHKYPIDAWRFFPDAGIALEEWSRRNGRIANLIESFVADRIPKTGVWNDFVAVFEVGTRSKGGILFMKFPCRNVIAFNLETGRVDRLNETRKTEDIEDLRSS